MGILTRLGQLFSRKSSDAKDPEAWFRDWLLGGQTSASGIVVSEMEAMRDVVTMACVSIRAADLAKLPVHVKRWKKNGGSEIVRDHPLAQLLRKPNRDQTKFEFFEQMQVAYLLKSNAYAATPRNGRGQPLAFLPIPPTQCSLWMEPGGSLYYRVTRSNDYDRARLAMFGDLIPSADMLHLRWLTTNGLSGLSRISLARDAIGLSRALEKFSSSLFARGGSPGGVYKTTGKLSEASFARLKQQIEEKHEGLSNHGKSMLLEEGLDWVKQTMTAVESQTVEARKLQIEQVATGFDVPLHRLGIMPEGGGDAILQSHQMYLNNTLSTDAERWENKLNDMFDLDGDEIGVEFDLDYFNRADIQTRLTALGTAITRSVYTVNEARRKEGLPDDPEGDIIFQPANMVPLGTPPASAQAPKPAGPGSDITGSPAPGGDGDPAAVPDPSSSEE
jgi:HK97 family phage portal protein